MRRYQVTLHNGDVICTEADGHTVVTASRFAENQTNKIELIKAMNALDTVGSQLVTSRCVITLQSL